MTTSVLQYTVMENLFGMHILIGTWDTKTLIGGLTVLREDSNIQSEYCVVSAITQGSAVCGRTEPRGAAKS